MEEDDNSARYTWDETNSPELLEDGEGPELDISGLVEASQKKPPRKIHAAVERS